MQLHRRRFGDEEDYWRIREFLRDVYRLNGRREFSWQAYRFDYCRWHIWENIEQIRCEDAIFIWEAGDGQIAAVLNREDGSNVFLQVHPHLRTTALEEDMLDIAETEFAPAGAEGDHKLCVWAEGHDAERQAMLARRGYAAEDWPEYQRRRSMALPIPDAPIAAGYTIRALGDAEELPRRSWVSWRAFHPNEPDDQYQGWTWYPNVQRAPLYRRDLDIVAVAPNGEFAAFCTVWFDDVTRTGAFEPVGAAPEHQRRGLGKAVMGEGLRRLARLGATQATVGSYSAAAHALYASVGFTNYDLAVPWSKTWFSA